MNQFYYGTGRRKTSVARVFIKKGTGIIIVNNKNYISYFKSTGKNNLIIKPLEITGKLKTFNAKITVKGGGISGQIGAISLGITRALIEFDKSLKPVLKEQGLTSRDSRKVERKKCGLKKARKSRQFSKR